MDSPSPDGALRGWTTFSSCEFAFLSHSDFQRYRRYGDWRASLRPQPVQGSGRSQSWPLASAMGVGVGMPLGRISTRPRISTRSAACCHDYFSGSGSRGRRRPRQPLGGVLGLHLGRWGETLVSPIARMPRGGGELHVEPLMQCYARSCLSRRMKHDPKSLWITMARPPLSVSSDHRRSSITSNDQHMPYRTHPKRSPPTCRTTCQVYPRPCEQ